MVKVKEMVLCVLYYYRSEGSVVPPSSVLCLLFALCSLLFALCSLLYKLHWQWTVTSTTCTTTLYNNLPMALERYCSMALCPFVVLWKECVCVCVCVCVCTLCVCTFCIFYLLGHLGHLLGHHPLGHHLLEHPTPNSSMNCCCLHGI